MSLSNSRLTSIIEESTQLLALSLRNESQTLQTQGRSESFDESKQIDYLLTDPLTGREVQSLESLNNNWRYLSYKPKDRPLFVSPVPTSQYDKDKLLEVIKIQLKAIARGYKSRTTDYSLPQRAPAQPRTPIIIREQPIQRVYYYGGYRRYDSGDFLRDWLVIDMLSHHHHHGGGYNGGGSSCCIPSPNAPAPTRSGGSKSDDKKGEVLLAILACVAIFSALILAGIAIVYMIGALSALGDEMIHLEKWPENLLKLAGTGMGAWGGIIGGVALGSALALSGGLPVLLGLCTMIIGAGLALFTSNQAFTGLHLLSNRSSAIDSDPRFSLSFLEKRQLRKTGYDTSCVEEAIREVGLLMKKNSSWHLKFWSDENKERKDLITLLRQLKKGYPAQYVSIKGKTFDLWQPAYQEAVPLYAINPPAYDTLIQNNIITAHPQASAPPMPVKASAPPMPVADRAQDEPYNQAPPSYYA